MRTSKLKEMHDVSVSLDAVNDILIEQTLKNLEKPGLSEEARLAEVRLLRIELESRDDFRRSQNLYKERKAENRGYFTALAGSVLGVVVGEIGLPKIIAKLKKK